MTKDKTAKSIESFKSKAHDYSQLLLKSRDSIIPKVVKNYDEIKERRSELNSMYAGLEKYIEKLGRKPRMRDGVNPEVYSTYDNAFSPDILLRVGPSINSVIQDLDYILGKLNAMEEDEFEAIFSVPKRDKVKSRSDTYVHKSRIEELKKINSTDFDLIKLIEYCREINITYAYDCHLAVAMLIRAILDHIPPIFGYTYFKDVLSQYGSKSWKQSMNNLELSSRKIADSFLHTPIRKKEVLPNTRQVDFTNDLDVLLAEIYRILK